MNSSKAPDLSGIDPAYHEKILALSESMANHGVNRDDPVRSVFGLLGDRWSTLILLVLSFGPWRHTELRRMLGRLGAEQKISQRVLTLKLRNLEREGLVSRHAEESVPPKVSYSLTKMGAELHSKAVDLIGWVNRNEPKILASRAKFDLLEE